MYTIIVKELGHEWHIKGNFGMKPFGLEKINSIKKQIDKALQDGAKPVAAFDADGTLWDTDLGENFFQYQIDSKSVDLPDNAWKHYEDMQEVNVAEAYLWLAQINRGQPIETVRAWSQKALDKISPVPVFPAIKEIISYLHKIKVEVYIVTASIRWAVEPGAALFEIPRENVLGITTEIVNGIVTDKQHGPITWREGKVTGLLNKTNGVPPFLAAGNTLGDLALLDAASHIRIANCAAPEGHRNWESEKKLSEVAKQRGWHLHSYI